MTFIQKASSDPKPFFLVVTPLAPHVEVSLKTFLQTSWAWDLRPAPRHVDTVFEPLPRPPSFNEADFSDKPEWMQDFRPPMTWLDTVEMTRRYRHRLESMRSVDDLVGDVIKALVGTGKLENTIILFTSDNGYLHGEHRQNGKFVAFEESIRVPLYVRLPGGSMQVRNQVVLNNDLAPTVAELAGVTPQLKVDGTSFVPLLGTPPDSWRRRFLVEHWQAGDVDASDVPTDVPTCAAVRTWSWYTNNMLYV